MINWKRADRDKPAKYMNVLVVVEMDGERWITAGFYRPIRHTWTVFEMGDSVDTDVVTHWAPMPLVEDEL